jgi:ribulose-phosphate 3-epimerase
MIAIEPSVLSADLTRLGEQAREAEAAGIDGLQVDVMDGRFVPSITFGPLVVKALRSVVSVPLDVHLMIVEPEKYLGDFAAAGADRLIVHQEACPHLHRILQCIHELGVQAAIALNPATPLCTLEEVLELTDAIQMMTVNPGFGGQPFIHSQLAKIHRLRQMLEERALDIPIAVDGGIDPSTAPLVVKAGATVLVAGSTIYNSKASVADNLAALRASVRSEGFSPSQRLKARTTNPRP